MIVLHAAFPIEPDAMDETLALVDDLVDATNEEPGVIDYRATRDVQDENTIRFFELYEDEAALEHHTQTEHFREFEDAIPARLAGEPDVRRFDVSDVTELEL